jgi:predicted 2-oxoglutarate/Fe(II)-dependent dioxygenase YbiX
MDGATCRRVRASMDAGRGEVAEVFAGSIEACEDVRRAHSMEVPEAVLDVVCRHLDAQREAIGAFFACTLAGREGPGLLRYEAGGFYRRHVDRAETASWPGAARRAITVILFLAGSREVDPAGPFGGGHLRVHVETAGAPVEIVPEEGMLVAFPAGTPHEVAPVTDGRRDAVVDWFYDA